MQKRDPSRAFSTEVQRVDTLLCKWGINVGNLGGARGRRREIALALAKDFPDQITDLVLDCFIKEGRLQGWKNPRAWAAKVLEDEGERNGYLPEILSQSNGAPRRGDPVEFGRKLRYSPGSQEALSRQAEVNGTTVSEEQHYYRQRWIYYRVKFDGVSLDLAAQEACVPLQQAQEEFEAERGVQEGKGS